jgi:hypothetical protein
MAVLQWRYYNGGTTMAVVLAETDSDTPNHTGGCVDGGANMLSTLIPTFTIPTPTICYAHHMLRPLYATPTICYARHMLRPLYATPTICYAHLFFWMTLVRSLS